ncbi:fimbrial protein [Providencia huaxiensis]|uniref:fimbrial protein n=1 Tax=Providencia TaxID=586 RepID=UPI0015ECBC39|nr:MULTISPECIES: fimbrial protein [Providencia]EHZ6873787.1 fimbrial protein [Providencia rettgeri]MDX7424118.1 fimbrial protein [Providencia sp. CIM-Carb-044]QLQ64757.1 fimbrial protein [Providencia rettgeri]URR20943.1 fimbrial protein [Providencia rettgeri]
MKTFIYKLIIIINLILLYCTNANANKCMPNPQNGKTGYLPPANIIIQADNSIPVNTVLASYNVHIYPIGYPTFLAGSVCNILIEYMYLNGWKVNSNKVAQTNVPGIGIKIYGLRKENTMALPHVSTTPGIFKFSATTLFPNEIVWYVDIIKTGSINSGALAAGPLARMQNRDPHKRETYVITSLYIPSNFKITNVSCSIKNNKSTYDIHLGDWYDTQFNNIGDTSTSADIPITLTCAAGTNIKTTVTSSAGYVDINTGKLALSGTDTATGVAIQLLDKNNAPIKLNTKNSLQNNIPSGDYMFNWKARYIKTADKITPGSANATATVNIRYE